MELQIRGVSKTYANGVQALKDVTLTIPAGMYGLLGPNGAGKSTLMRMIATLQEPDTGTITLGDIDVVRQKDEVRKTLGYLPQEFGVYPKVSAESLLDHFAVLKGITERRARKEVVEALLRQTNLWDVRKQKLGGYSGGMRQRFGVAVALLGDPKLMIVDEPTAGLDPAERVRFLNLLSELGREQRRHPLHAHRRGRLRAVHPDGDHRQGRDPARSRAAARRRGAPGPDLAPRDFDGALPELEREHAVISTKLYAGRTVAHVYCDSTPDPALSPPSRTSKMSTSARWRDASAGDASTQASEGRP